MQDGLDSPVEDSGTNGGNTELPSGEVQTKNTDYQYMQVMYSDKGAELNSTVLNGAVYNLYSQEIQNALNLTLQFPFQTTASTRSNSALTPWYNTLPPELDLTAANGDITLAIEKYFKTTEGRDYLITYLQNASAQLTAIENFEINNGYTGPDEGMQDFTNFAGLVGSIVEIYYSYNKAQAVMNCVQILGDIVFGMGSSPEELISQQLVQIQRQLVQIQQSLARIETKLGKIEAILTENTLDGKYANAAKARTYLRSILEILDGDLDESNIAYLKTTLESFSTADYRYQFNIAFDSAQKTLEYMHRRVFRDNYESIKKTIPIKLEKNYFYMLNPYDVKRSKNVTSSYDSFPIDHFMLGYESTQTASLENSTNLGISSEDISLMKRFSLTRLLIAGKVYEGETLLRKRAEWADQDLKKLQIIKTALNNIPDLILKEMQQKEMLFNDVDIYTQILEDGRLATFGYFQFDLTKNNTTIYKETHCIKNFCDDGAEAVPSFFADEKRYIDQNIFHNTLFTSLIQDPDFKSKLITAYTMLAEWEIQLRAHIKAAEQAGL
jgi:hypothetical protein